MAHLIMPCGVIFIFLMYATYEYKYHHVAHTDPCLLNRQSKTCLPTNGYRRMLVRQLQLRRFYGLGNDTLLFIVYVSLNHMLRERSAT